MEFRPIEYVDGVIRAIDQGALPARERVLTLTTTKQLAAAIRALRVRGAPMLGIAGAMGVAQAARRARARDAQAVLQSAADAAEVLKATRPTAVNLAWAIDRTLRAGREALDRFADPDAVRKAVETEAAAIADEDDAACRAMAEHGQQFIPDGARVLTHCNTGALCTGGAGTALGVIRRAHEEGKNIAVLATESRPLLQGARLTTWELGRLGIPHELVADGAAPALIARGDVDTVVVGADRIAANGDVANKIGTYALALAAREARIPFVVVAPVSTIDPALPDGRTITIEERDPDEVTTVLGRRIAPAETRARNPAFDVTPARLITAIVTDAGVAKPPNHKTVLRLANALHSG